MVGHHNPIQILNKMQSYKMQNWLKNNPCPHVGVLSTASDFWETVGSQMFCIHLMCACMSRHLEWSCFSLCSSATENKEHLEGKTIVLITYNKNTHQRDHMIAICSMENRWVALAIHSLVVSSVLMFFRCSGVKSMLKSWKCEHTSLWWHRLLKFQGKIIETTLVSRLLTVDVTENGSKLSTILPMRCLITRNMDITLSGGNTHLEPKHPKKKSTSWNETTTISYAYHVCSLTVPRNAQKKTEFKSACVFFNFCISANAKTITIYLWRVVDFNLSCTLSFR